MGEVLAMIFGGLILAVAGAGVGYWFGAGGRQRSKADAIQQEFDDYRKRVGEHFSQTARHFQTIGREYRALYDHMASGAESLCDSRAAEDRLSFDPQPQPPAAVAKDAADKRKGRDDGPAGAVQERGTDAGEGSKGTGDAPDRSATGGVKATASGGQAAANDADDDSTPDRRARDAGGESAPAEDEDEEADGSVDAAAPDGETGKDEAEDSDGKTPVGEKAARDAGGEHILH